jgi:hypothetical protein
MQLKVMQSIAQQSVRGQFNKALLPSPLQFCQREGIKLGRPSRCNARGRCPIHGGKNATAFSINIDTGAAFCFNCGFKCGDIIDLARALWKCAFVEACKRLGCWEEKALTPAERRRIARDREEQKNKRERIERAAETLEAQERAQRLAVRDLLHAAERRGRELVLNPRGGDDEWWQALAEAHDALRRYTAAYAILSFADIATRAQFVLADRRVRKELVGTALMRGYVVTQGECLHYFDLDDGPRAGRADDTRGIPNSRKELA